ncbi:MAG: tetratricopeptide repeat protein [Proteobacteria bacterium]|nr:tetratricopeptide repeat protein [Pseudomonadota bacterium]
MSEDTLRHQEPWDGARSEAAGTNIDAYTLLRRIGEGGFGDVWEAEQFEPVHRKVALKIVKLGMDTREVIARFELERQALAMMDHPHIARVFDAGATPSGRPYFVMELVEGEPITAFCDTQTLPIESRLRLFGQVCAAVQHAHTKGLIHRDLKPGNVLVGSHDGAPFAKVIDFGIAKATSGELSERTHATRIDQVMGTPLYMSPEQARGSDDIDTRTDIYALGVILYELLTGSTPVERSQLQAASLADTQRLICEAEPQPPSARLRKAAATSGGATATTTGFHATQARTLARRVRGELDWIVMKAIEKDRSRRYETASALGADVQRFLDGQPVQAAPPSRAYRFGKFVHRHKFGVAAGALLTVSLVGGIVAFAWQARVAREQAQLAQQRADELKQVADFQAAMLGRIDPTQIGKLLSDDVLDRYGKALAKAGLPPIERTHQLAAFGEQWERVNATDSAVALINRTLLVPAIHAIDRKFRDQPLVDASLRQALADSYAALGLFDQAMPLQERALALRRHVSGDSDIDTAASMQAMGTLLKMQGKPEQAEPWLRKALAIRRRVLGENHRDTLASLAALGEALDNEGEFDRADPITRDALARRQRFLGKDDPDTIESLSLMGGLLLDQGKPTQAIPIMRDVLADRRRVLGEDDPQTLGAINDLGAAWMMQGKPDQAEPYFREAWEKHRRLQGEDHPDTLQSLANLGGVLMVEGKAAQAEPVLRDAIARCTRILGADNGTTLLAVASLGKVLLDQHRPGDAERWLSPSLQAARDNLASASPPQFGFFMLVLGKARAAQDEFSAAESALLEAHASFQKAAGSQRGTYPMMCLHALVDLYTAWDKAEPGKGHAAKAAQWKAALAKLDAPATTK